MIAQRTLINHMALGIDVAATIRAGLNAIPASNAIGRIDQHNPLGTIVGSTHRTNLDTRRFLTVVAHFRNKERLENIGIGSLLSKAVDTAIWRINLYRAVVKDGILFHPGPEKEWLTRHAVFGFACIGASSAANTFFEIDTHSIPGTVWIFPFGGK